MCNTWEEKKGAGAFRLLSFFSTRVASGGALSESVDGETFAGVFATMWPDGGTEDPLQGHHPRARQRRVWARRGGGRRRGKSFAARKERDSPGAPKALDSSGCEWKVQTDSG